MFPTEPTDRTSGSGSGSGSLADLAADRTRCAHRTSDDDAHRTSDDDAHRTSGNSVLRSEAAARQWLDEDVVMQAFAYAACKDQEFCDWVPYKLFHRCCYTLAMVSDDHQHIIDTAAADCIRVWRLEDQSTTEPYVDPFTDPSNELIFRNDL